MALLVVAGLTALASEWRRAAGDSAGAGAAAAHWSPPTVRPTARLLHDQPPPRDHRATQLEWRQHWRAAERERLHGASPRRLNVPSSWALDEEEAAWRVPPRYSTFTCFGPKPDDRWQA